MDNRMTAQAPVIHPEVTLSEAARQAAYNSGYADGCIDGGATVAERVKAAMQLAEAQLLLAAARD